MLTKILRLLPFAVLVCTSALPAAEMTQKRQHFDQKAKHRQTLDYLLYLPEGYRENTRRKWPLILFLHGMGERGTNLDKVKVHGPPKLLDGATNLPFVVVSPQCPLGQWWDVETLDALLEKIIRKERIDTRRVYLTGLSMGGFGSWELAMKFPDRFAAVAPICGGGNPFYPAGYTKRQAAVLKEIPFWAFHGAKDTSVPLSESQRMVDALKKFGCDVKFTVYPEAGHDSWTETYNNPELYEWFLRHEKQR